MVVRPIFYHMPLWLQGLVMFQALFGMFPVLGFDCTLYHRIMHDQCFLGGKARQGAGGGEAKADALESSKQ